MELTFNATKEKEKLDNIVSNMPANKIELMQGLIADASFMAEQLEILRNHITVNGWSEQYKNGQNQYGKKESVEASAYHKTLKLYTTVIKQLSDQIDKTIDNNTNDELLEFLKNN